MSTVYGETKKLMVTTKNHYIVVYNLSISTVSYRKHGIKEKKHLYNMNKDRIRMGP